MKNIGSCLRAFLIFLFMAASFAFAAGGAAAQTLTISNVAAPTVVGTGQGKRAIWTNAGTVGSTAIDLVARLDTATLNHNFTTQTNRPAITSVGPDDIWTTWRLFEAGTYDINTDSGGVPVVANIHIQLNDVDGPNNERAYLPVCSGAIQWVRIQKNATTGRAFGTVAGRPEIFSLVGDRSYNAEPESGVEPLYPNASSFQFGRRANNNFFIRVDNPTYTAFDTYDYQCADFKPPVANNDSQPLVAGANTVPILQNDSIATGNQSGNPSEWGVEAVSLTAPSGATGVVTDSLGHVTSFTVPNEGTWTYDDSTGILTFTADPALGGSPTPITYIFYNALTPSPGIASNAATVTLTAPIDAVDDPATAVGGNAGNPNVINAFTNDMLNGAPLDPADITATVVTPATNPNVSLNVSTGVVSVAPNTAAGTYTIVYRICEVTVTSNCDQATITVPVTAPTIDAVADNASPVNGAAGTTNALNAFTNDTIDGTPVNASAITATVLTPAANPNVALDTTTGVVSVAPNTAAGTYTITYRICENLNPTNCDTADITVPVFAAPIDAVDDTPPATNGAAGNTNVVNAFMNDTLNGTPVSAGVITTTVVTPASNPNVALNTSTGIVSVAPNTAAGTYTITYRICENINPTNCDTADITVPVTAAPIDAVDDAPAATNSVSGNANLVNAFTNDTLNGSPISAAAITATVVTPASNPNVALNTSTGVVSVAPNTAAGTYTITYRICENINPTNCDTANITVSVVAAAIDAVNDTPSPTNGASGSTNVVNAFANDTLNGAPVSTSQITATIVTPSANPNVALDTLTGIVSVAPNTPAVTYTITYRICETVNPSNCDTADVMVAVAPPPIDAVNDTPASVNGASGSTNVVNAFANDTLNGAPVNTSAITATIVTPAANLNVALDTSTGIVSVAPNTPAGTYTITYQICENLNPTNCDTADVTVAVGAAPIDAVADSPPSVAGAAGNPNLVNAFANDTLNGSPVSPSAITATVTTPATNPNVQLDTGTGTVSVAANTPAGTYTVTYQICEAINPTNCDSAVITVIIDASPIDAVDDTPAAVSGVTGDTNVVNVFVNDTLGGAPADPANLTTTVVTPASNPGVSLNTSTGVISVAAGTPAANYTITYRICETVNPTNCDNAVATIAVTAATINAANDNPAPVAGTGNPNLVNVLTNDTLNGSPVDLAQVTTTIVTPSSNPNVALDTLTGVVSVAGNTPTGTYTITYQICESINPSNCDSATVSVVVTAPVIDAVNDTPPAVGGAAGNANLVNVLTNDTLAGSSVDPTQITTTVVMPASNPNVALNVSTGVVSVAPNTAAGTYTIVYRICENLNPTNCDTATVTVNVTAATIDAVNDTPAPVTAAGNPNLVNVLTNDTLNGSPVDPAQVTMTIVTPASNPNVALNTSTGVVSVAANTPAGTYTITYQICENLNPANCDGATVTVSVTAATIDAVNDSPAPVSGTVGNTNLVNVFANDTLASAPIDPAQITTIVVTPASNPNVALNTSTGAVSVAANTPSGTYTITYQICENLNPSNCDAATVTVVVSPSAIDAVNDTPAPVAVGAGNSNLVNAFANDTLNGAPADPSLITATIVTPASNPGVSLNTSTGAVSVAAATPAGTYTITYQICDNLNPATCDTAVISVSVTSGAIDAVNDTPAPVVGATGNPNAVNVLTNDTLNGGPATTTNVVLTVVTPASDSRVSLNPATGVVSVAPGTPAGTYSIAYQICAVSDPANCDGATVTVQVAAATIVANDDTLGTPVDTKDPVNNAINVLINDRLNGGPVSYLAVNVTPVGTLPAGFFLQMDGTVDIAENTPSGVYTFTYRICEVANPANCDTATVTIPVQKSVPSIAGTVYFDNNGNGSLDAGDRRLPGYTVQLRQNGVVVRTTTSAADGSYRFQDFPPGSGYDVVFIDPAAGIAVGSIEDLNFGPDTELINQNQAIDPSGVVYNSATGAPLAGVKIEIRTAGNVPLPDACLLPGQQGQTTGATGAYRFDIVPGAAPECPVGQTEYRLVIVAYPAGVVPGTSTVVPPQPGAIDVGTCPEDAVPGGACQLSATSEPPSPGAPTPYYLVFLIAAGDPNVINNHIPLDPQSVIPANGLSITKRSNVSVVRRDEAVSYVIVASNANAVPAGELDVRDKLPVGFAFIAGSASIDGVAIAPQVSGRILVFHNIIIPATGSVEIRLTVRVGADVTPGEQVNQAWISDPLSGEALTNIARAVVRVLAEHVFDCGEIIGKVFNDLNRDGSQDEGEKGLPGVRVVTVNGILITTDKHGRFSVPCAELPDQTIGSNFILKLDTRTLPDGFRVTTENPRVVRLTAGKVTKLNFGAAASNVINVAITGRAFEAGTARPTRELSDGIGQLVDIADKQGSSLNVVYDTSGEPPDLARKRLKNVQALIAAVWRERGKALPFELRVVGLE